MADLKKVYAAVDEETALYELERFADKWDSKYPKISASWKAHWPELSTYFKYPQSVRTLIYTTNSIENFNRQLRKVSKNKSVFPNDDSLLKMLYLVQADITRSRTGRRRYRVIFILGLRFSLPTGCRSSRNSQPCKGWNERLPQQPPWHALLFLLLCKYGVQAVFRLSRHLSLYFFIPYFGLYT